MQMNVAEVQLSAVRVGDSGKPDRRVDENDKPVGEEDSGSIDFQIDGWAKQLWVIFGRQRVSLRVEAELRAAVQSGVVLPPVDGECDLAPATPSEAVFRVPGTQAQID